MIPDLGRYTFEVTMSYGVSLTLLALLVAGYVTRARRMKRRLAAAEARQNA